MAFSQTSSWSSGIPWPRKSESLLKARTVPSRLNLLLLLPRLESVALVMRVKVSVVVS
jgi:hypothetical protein